MGMYLHILHLLAMKFGELMDTSGNVSDDKKNA